MRRCPLPLFRLFALASLLVVVTCRSNYASKYDDRFRHYNREQNGQQEDQDHDYGFQRVAREREGHLSNDYLKGKFGTTSDKRTPTFKSFQPGYKFQFLYDSQITSGYAPWVSVQRAMARFQALATFEAIGPGEASMQLSECLIGQLNGQSPTAGVWNPGQLLPVRVFESVMHFSHVQLEQPVRFTYSRDGIHHIYFDPMEPAWSRNYKKAILSTGQFRLGAKDDGDEADQNQTNQTERAEEWKPKWQQTFSVHETSIEGNCETDYTIVPFSRELISVTKSINFDRCIRLADIAYGMQADEEAKQRGQHNNKPYQEQRERTDNEQQLNGGANPMISRQFLDRSTTIRYLFVNQLKNNSMDLDYSSLLPHSVELLSQYTLKGSEAEQSQAMQTVAVAKLTYIETKQNRHKKNKRQQQQDDKSGLEREQLLYTGEMEQQEKCFFMFGDETSETVRCQRRAKAFNNDELRGVPLVISGSRMPSPGSPFPLNFPNSTTKMRRAEICVRNVAQAQAEDNDGTLQAMSQAEFMDEFVQLLRFSTEQELKQLKERLDNDRIAAQLFADALAAAGTRNTLKLLLTRIEQGEFTELKAAQMLKTFSRGSGLPAPSDRIADALLALCKTEHVQNSELLRQTSWLSFGAIVGELMQLKRIQRQSPVGTPLGEKIEQCPDHKMELYTKALLEQFSTGAGDDKMEKIVALKAIGNAALDEVPEVLATLINPNWSEQQNDEQPKSFAKQLQEMQRQNAIEALRRIPSARVQQLLLPVYTNQQELPQTRIAALGVLMQSQLLPSDAVIEQIAFTMAKERCPQVLAYSYTTLKALSQSPAKRHQHSAQRIKEALRVSGLDELELEKRIRHKDIVGLSRFVQTNSLYSAEEGQGILLQASNVFTGKTSALPNHAFLSLSSLFNGQMSEEQLKLTVSQWNIERLLFTDAGLKELLKNGQEDHQQQQRNDTQQQQQPSEESSSSSSWTSSAAEQLRSLWRRLSIVGRSEDEQSTDQMQQQKPVMLLALRVNNIDTVVLPFGIGGQQRSNSLISALKKLLAVGIGSISKLTGTSQHRQPVVDTSGILFWHERAARVPMSTGQQLHVQLKSFLYGSIRANAERLGHSHIGLRLHPSATFGRIQKMKVWASPVHSSGVKNIGAIEVNMPLKAQLNTLSQQKQVKLNIQVPQTPTRLFSMHTMPMTFVGMEDTQNNLSQQPSVFSHFGEQCKAVQNQQLLSMAKTFDKHSNTEQSFLQLPFHVRGFMHMPRRMDKLKEWVKVLLSAENHYQVTLEPQAGRSPHEIAFYLGWNLFQPHPTIGGLSRAELKQFLNLFTLITPKSGDGEEADREEQWWTAAASSASSSAEESQKEEQQQRRIGAYLDKLGERKAYKHTLKASMEIVGSDQNRQAEFKLDSVCDERMRSCTLHAQVQHSAVGQQQQPQWSADLRVQSLYPEQAPDLEHVMLHSREDKRQQQQQMFLCRAELEWNANGQLKEMIKLNIKGEPSTEMLRLAHQFVQQQSSGSNVVANSAVLPTNAGHPFVDKYTAVVDWQLRPAAQNCFIRYLETIKSACFFNADSKIVMSSNNDDDSEEENSMISTGRQQQQQQQGVKQGTTITTLSIDPITHQHINMTVRAADQLTVFRMVKMGTPVRPFPLVRSSPAGAFSNAAPARVMSISRLVHQMAHPFRSRAICRLDTSKRQIRTFDGAERIDTPIPKCWTVLAKDCSAEGQSQYAVLIKSSSSSDNNQMKLKVIAPEIGILLVEPRAQQPDTNKQPQLQLQLHINEKQQQQKRTFTSDTPLSDLPDGIEFAHSSSTGKEAVIIETTTSINGAEPIAGTTGALSVHFDGQKVRITLNGQQNRQKPCGLCGNWNDNAEDELSLPDGSQTESAKAFNRAYSLIDDEGEEGGECEHNGILDKFHAQQEETELYGQQQQQLNTSGTVLEQIEPVLKTVLIEYPHQLCFSLKPVKQCPSSSLTARNIAGELMDQQKQQQQQEAEEEEEEEAPKQQKVPFTCIERHNVEAKRFKAQARRGEAVQLGDHRPISFQEVIIEADRCIKFDG